MGAPVKLEVDAPDGHCDPEVLKNVILAMVPQARVKIFTPIEKVFSPLKAMSKEEIELMRKAEAIADAVMKAPLGASWNGIYLQALLVGGDSWEMSQGEALQSPRAEAIAFSRYMKKIKLFQDYESPAQFLAHHKRIYFKGGGYKGVEYIPTKLGMAVHQRLKDKMWLQAHSKT